MPVIRPDDVIAEGAKPDGQTKASRGNTEQLQTGTAGSPEPPKPAQQPKPEPPKSDAPTMTAQNTNPNALRLPNLMESANRIVQHSIDDQKKSGTGGARTGVQGPVVQESPDFSTSEDAKILSDTRGYDFGPYMNQVVNRVRVNWYSLLPEIARLGRRGRVVIVFTITANGSVANLQLVANSGTEPLDRSAIGSINLSNPFPKLPPGFDGDHLTLQFTYLYNMPVP
jgi:TonB family protein